MKKVAVTVRSKDSLCASHQIAVNFGQGHDVWGLGMAKRCFEEPSSGGPTVQRSRFFPCNAKAIMLKIVWGWSNHGFRAFERGMAPLSPGSDPDLRDSCLRLGRRVCSAPSMTSETPGGRTQKHTTAEWCRGQHLSYPKTGSQEVRSVSPQPPNKSRGVLIYPTPRGPDLSLIRVAGPRFVLRRSDSSTDPGPSTGP